MTRHAFGTLFLILFGVSQMAAARTGSVSGRILSDAGMPVPFASVLLVRSSDSALMKSELTNEKGEYDLTPVGSGTYFIKTMLMGYKQERTDNFLIGDAQVTMPDIVLAQADNTLKEVAVRGQKQFVEVRADKIVVNVENSIVSAGGSVMDVLSHSPGVNVDQSDNISLKGKQGVNVMINGKIQPMTGADLAALLKSMPSNSVETIELISNPSAKYDAAGTAGIIDIKMKKDKKTGLNGSVNGTYAQGVYGKGSGGFSMNYRNKRVNVFAGFNESSRTGFNRLMLDRRFYSGGVFSGAYVQDNYFINRFVNGTGNVGVDYTLSKKTTIGAVLTGSYFTWYATGNNKADVIDSASQKTVSHFNTKSDAPNHFNNGAVNLNMRHTFDSTGKSISVDVDHAGYTNWGHQDYTTIYTDMTGATLHSPDVLHGEKSGITQISSVKADYLHPLKNNARFETGIKASYVIADNNPRFYNVIGGVYLPDASKTDHFIYEEHINAGYVNYNLDRSKWSTQLGLRAEQTVARGTNKTADTSFNRNYINLFPSGAVQRHIDANNDLGLTLSRRVTRPSYQQLNPFKYYLDPTTYTEGFPYLQPALAYSFELSHVYKQRLITTLSYVYTTNPITEVIQPSETEAKVTVQTNKNLTSMSWYGLSGSYQLKLTKWWNNITNGNVYYANYTGNIAGTYLNKGNTTFDINTTNTFLLPMNWSGELSFNYQAPQVYGYMVLRPTWMLNAGVQKNLFNKKATLKLNVTDIFRHGYPAATSYYADYVESFVAVRDTRQASISFTYRFGKRTVPPVMKHSGGAEDEKQRAGQGA